MNEHEKVRNNTEFKNWATLDPPALMEENDGLELQPTSTPPRLFEQCKNCKNYNMMTNVGYDKATCQTQKQYVQKPID